jgi:hypothetical protein
MVTGLRRQEAGQPFGVSACDLSIAKSKLPPLLKAQLARVATAAKAAAAAATATAAAPQAVAAPGLQLLGTGGRRKAGCRSCINLNLD